MEKVKQQLELIGEYIKNSLIVELAQQGHRATGTLMESIEHRVLASSTFALLHGEFIFYGRFVESGRRPGAKRVPVDVLEAWIRQKGFETDAKKVRGMAFAIQRTIFEKGISTPQSWAGESTKNFLTKTLDGLADRIEKDIEQAVDEQMEVTIINMINEAQRFAKTYGIAA